VLSACGTDDPVATPLEGRSEFSQTRLVAGGDHGVEQVLADELIFWGGRRGTGAATMSVNTGWHYDSATGTWRAMAPSPLAPRWGHMAFMHRGELHVIGGVGHVDGAAWNPRTNQWRMLPLALPAVSQGFDVEAVWDGRRVVLWNRSSGQVWVWTPGGPEDTITVWRALPELVVPDLFGSSLVATEWGIVALADTPQRLEQRAVRLWLLQDDGWRRLADADFTAAGVGLIEVENHAWVADRLIVWNGDVTAGATRVLREPWGTWGRGDPPVVPGCEASHLPAVVGPEEQPMVLAHDFCGDAAVFDVFLGTWRTIALPPGATDAVPFQLNDSTTWTIDESGVLQELDLSATG